MRHNPRQRRVFHNRAGDSQVHEGTRSFEVEFY